MLFLVDERALTKIDSGISQAVRDANKISMTMNIFGDSRIEAAVTAKKHSFKRNTTGVWPDYSFFKHQPWDFGVEEEDIPENSVIHLNQGYRDYFIIGKINESLNSTENLSTYEFNDREMKMFCPKYDSVSGTFQGLYETIRYIMVRSNGDDHFLDYGYLKQDSKLLHSFHKKRMTNSFSGIFFNRHRIQYESRAIDTKFSKTFYFRLSITDRVEDVKRHMRLAHLYPIDVPYNSFEIENVEFDPSKLDYENNPDKLKMTESVIKILKKP